jgi:hypothetical protein
MSQTVSSDPKTLARAIDAAMSPRPTAMQQLPDRYANHLMDEIFDEVEQVLDGSLLPPDEPVQVQFAKPDLNLDIANLLAERYPLLAQKLEEANAAPIPDLPGPDMALHKPDERRVAVPAPSGLSLFERFMIFTGCASAVAALAVWLISQGLVTKGANFLSRQLASTPVVATAPVSPVNAADVQFSEYVLRSLAALDRDAAANPQMVAAMPAAPASPLGAKPAPTASGTMLPKPNVSQLKGATNQPGGKLGAVQPIAPIYQPVQPMPQTDLVTRSEMNQVMNRIVGMLERVAPGVSNRLPLPAGTTSQAAKAPVRIAAAVKPAAKPAPPASNEPKRRLSGVVEFGGGKSVVTIEYNGSTQRVYIGEPVGNTGWTLIDVKGTTATFRKNGEIRTLSDQEFF